MGVGYVGNQGGNDAATLTQNAGLMFEKEILHIQSELVFAIFRSSRAEEFYEKKCY